ncbi:hypothetical protein E5288_WYG017368 [Bos mutus]|uniref:Uncharacterized protein n=1 Tax=Bos mutus TaxID=72004 RepID=A0A6B0RIR8_9CETA|nr:hypothetical protein [Bos mutus]
MLVVAAGGSPQVRSNGPGTGRRVSVVPVGPCGHVHQGLGDVGLKLGNKTVDQDAGLEREESKALSSEADGGRKQILGTTYSGGRENGVEQTDEGGLSRFLLDTAYETSDSIRPSAT